MNKNLTVSLDRADEIFQDMEAEYAKALEAREVSPRAIHLTHELCSLLRGVLDRAARVYWEKLVSPSISTQDREKATIYFPIAAEPAGLDSTLGRWRWKGVRNDHEAIYNFMLNLQPFASPSNRWLQILSDLASQGKHVDLVPQRKVNQRRMTVTFAGRGSVVVGSGVRFGPGVSLFGAPINPLTQRIVPTPGVTDFVEIWTSFIIEGHGVDALGFCRDACSNTRRLVSDLFARFDL